MNTEGIFARAITLENLFDTPEGKQVLSCIQCGMCVGTCPYGEYMEYPPRRIIQMIRNGHLEDVIKSDSLLKCVSCYACRIKCPRDIQLTGVLLPLVKEKVIENLVTLPSEMQKSLMSTLRYGNPMGESPRKRSAWVSTAGVPVRIMSEKPAEPVDVLWFVECYTSFYPRGQDTCRATARILNRLGVRFGILGAEEKCAGDCGRLPWESGLSETLVEYNLETFKKYKFNRIVTSDPHALDAMKQRYPAYGFDYNLDHIVSLLFEHIDAIRPMLVKPLNCTVTYHDSCCLGRHNKIIDEPRQLLEAIPGIKLVDMVHNRDNTLCCGGGGGGMWLDTYYKSQNMERLSERRIKEAVATGAEILAVACPYEVPRFEDALKVVGYDDKMIVRDITELLAESMGGN
jgi:dimethylglycine catabolism B